MGVARGQITLNISDYLSYQTFIMTAIPEGKDVKPFPKITGIKVFLVGGVSQ